MTDKHTILSLFSCCGGLDLGLEGHFAVTARQIDQVVHKDWVDGILEDGRLLLAENDFTTVFANDIDKNAKAAWTRFFQIQEHRNDAEYMLGSVVDLVKQAKAGKYVFPNADIVTGGFPCQPFSIAGKRQGFKDTKSDTEENLDAPSPESRGMLYYWMREVIGIVKPKMFIAENVKGLVSLGDVQQVIEKDFSSCGNGYIVVPARVLHSADYGVAQNRERIIFFGFDQTQLSKEALEALNSEHIPAEFDPYPIPTHNYTSPDDKDLLPFFTAEEALNGLGEPENSSDLSHKAYSKAKFMGKHCQGQTEVKLDGIGPTIRSKHHGNIEYRRLSKEHDGTHDEELKAGLAERRLSVRECARIQSFPDEYEFVFPKEKDADGKVIAAGVSGSAAYVLVGNAVPPLLGYHIARRIMECWNLWFKK